MIISLSSPDRSLFHGEAKYVIAKTIEGTIQILENHIPLISVLGIGLIKIVDNNNKIKKFTISGGYIHTNGKKVIIVSRMCEDIESIDINRAKIAENIARKELNSKHVGTAEYDLAKIALRKAINRVHSQE